MQKERSYLNVDLLWHEASLRLILIVHNALVCFQINLTPFSQNTLMKVGYKDTGKIGKTEVSIDAEEQNA
jgi:hypothetical protein